MKEITSKRTGHIEIISDETWDILVGNGKSKLFNVSEVIERKLKPAPIKPPELNTKTKKSNG